MTPNEFHLWRKEMGLTLQRAATALGRSKSAIEQYDSGRRKDTKETVSIPNVVAMACELIREAKKGSEVSWKPWDTAPKTNIPINVRMCAKDGSKCVVTSNWQTDRWVIFFTKKGLLDDEMFHPDAWTPCPSVL